MRGRGDEVRRTFAILAAIGMLTVVVATAKAGHDPNHLLSVDDGDFFYDTDGDCVGDTDDHTQGEALRHWHGGVPLLGSEAEPLGGFGCLGGPESWTVTVFPDRTATVDGRIKYTWDQNVPGGGDNDVHLHIYDSEGDLVASTLTTDGHKPVVPHVLQVREHSFSFFLGPGTYTIQEDVFSGEHTAWLTRLDVTQSDDPGNPY